MIAIVPSADRGKATVKVRVGLDQKDGRIVPDMGVRVSFLGAQGDGDCARRPRVSWCRRRRRSPSATGTSVVFVVAARQGAMQRSRRSGRRSTSARIKLGAGGCGKAGEQRGPVAGIESLARRRQR